MCFWREQPDCLYAVGLNRDPCYPWRPLNEQTKPFLALPDKFKCKFVTILSPPPYPIFNAAYDLSKIPNIPILTPLESKTVPTCPQASNACSWTCNSCIRNTDITHCSSYHNWGLSFDDGPSQTTPSLLHYLWHQNTSATFFVTGSNIAIYPDILKQEFDQNHQIVIHTWSHRALTTLTNEQVLAE